MIEFVSWAEDDDIVAAYEYILETAIMSALNFLKRNNVEMERTEIDDRQSELYQKLKEKYGWKN